MIYLHKNKDEVEISRADKIVSVFKDNTWMLSSSDMHYVDKQAEDEYFVGSVRMSQTYDRDKSPDNT